MIISRSEKQVLQKYYAEQIKSRAQNLKQLIQEDKMDMLANHILDIKEAGTRICQIQNDWYADDEKMKEEAEVEE